MLCHAKNWGLSLKFFSLESIEVCDGVFSKVHSTSAANRTWSAIVPLCRIFREQGIVHFCAISVEETSHLCQKPV